MTTVARIFIADGTFADCALGTMTWEQFIHQFIVNNAIVTSEVWINRQGVTKIIRIEVADVPEGTSNVLVFTPPQGSV